MGNDELAFGFDIKRMGNDELAFTYGRARISRILMLICTVFSVLLLSVLVFKLGVHGAVVLLFSIVRRRGRLVQVGKDADLFLLQVVVGLLNLLGRASLHDASHLVQLVAQGKLVLVRNATSMLPKVLQRKKTSDSVK